MKTIRSSLPFIMAWLVAVSAHGQTWHYVDVNGTNATPPFTNWQTAATVIQDAIDVATNGDTVCVASGVYSNGFGACAPVTGNSNRVTIAKPITVRSANGPEETVIVGAGPLSYSGVRCVFLTNGAVLSGFTLRGGTSHSFSQTIGGGGAYVDNNSLLTNCVVTACEAYNGGGIFCRSNGLAVSCMVVSNYATSGGGAYLSGPMARLLQSTLRGNTTTTGGNGGGAYVHAAYADGGGWLEECDISGNTTSGSGGAVYLYSGGVVTNCLVQSNRCDQAGAGIACAWGGIVDRCRMFGNVAESSGSGLGGGVDLASGGWVRNSLIAGNTAKYRGGGVSLRYKGTVENCTITTNRTYDNSSGGGAGGLHCDWSGAKLVRNCIIWNNDSSNNMPNWGTNYNTTGSVFEYCCTHPTNGLMGNVACFDADPLFVDGNARNFRTGYGSPCIDAGTNSVDGASIDLDGVLRPLDGNFDSVAQYDVGAYEYTPASADTDNDGMPDAWELGYGLNPTNAADATANPDGDPHNNLEEYFADTSPTNALSFLRIVALADLPPWTVYYEPSSTNRFYTLLYSTNLATANWTPLAGRVRVPGQGGVRTLTDTNLDRVRFYRVMAGP